MTKAPDIKLIVGLGNPGTEFQYTRHNAGFWFVDALANQFGNGALQADQKFKGLVGSINLGGKSVRLLKPNTFMNLSGQSVAALANFYKIDYEQILVAHDELDILPGSARLKIGGGHGGHNGLRDIISSLGNQKNFARLRIGIGHPGNAKQVSNFVLKKAPEKEQDYIDQTIVECVKHMEPVLRGDWQIAMNTLHSFNANPEARAKAEAARLEKEQKKQARAEQRAAQRAQQTIAQQQSTSTDTNNPPDQEES